MSPIGPITPGTGVPAGAQAGSLNSPVTFPTLTTTSVFTGFGSFGVGEWLIEVALTVTGGTTANPAGLEGQLIVDSGTGTLAGQVSTQYSLTASSNRGLMTATAILTVTAGPVTLTYEVYNNDSISTPEAISATNGTAAYPDASGWIARQVA